MNNLLTFTCLCVSLTAVGSTWFQTGWLGRLVQYHKTKFLDELNEVAPIKIKASIVQKEPGFVDSSEWDFNSVLRLVTLMRQSQQTAPARRALRRMLQPMTRRFISKAQSYKFFPSLSKNHPNEFYYDIDSDEMYEEADNTTSSSLLDEDAVLVITNPVEARLPSAQISVKLLKQILENRAKAGRQMPTTKKALKATEKDNETTSDDNVTATDTSNDMSASDDSSSPDSSALDSSTTDSTSPTA
ncbi:uncharacterized protein LOC135085728 [Ostrinia nubilalis]|uniref:uncharacterized protein LOC135085728 n=1 Tax=Ostrinia nubilalis TaxID=29057 RepID=UPI00308245D1